MLSIQGSRLSTRTHFRLATVRGVFSVVSALALAACGSSKQSAPVELLSGFQPLSTPPGGLAMYTPIIKDIQPGQDVTYCTYTDVYAPTDLFVHEIDGVQSAFGHHVIVFYAPTPETPRTEECFGSDMTKFRQLLGGAGAEGAFTWKPPANTGTTIPAGSQFVLQSHWINTSAHVTDAQAMAVTIPGDTGPDRIPLGTLAVVDTTFSIPPMSPFETSVQCTFPSQERLIMSIGHEHEWGNHVHAEVTRAAGATELLFDRPFQTSDEFNPPVNDYGVLNPLVLSPGDTVKMTCDWNNDTADSLTFPREMCVFFGYSLENQDAICVNNQWTTSSSPGGDGGAGAPDGAPTL